MGENELEFRAEKGKVPEKRERTAFNTRVKRDESARDTRLDTRG